MILLYQLIMTVLLAGLYPLAFLLAVIGKRNYLSRLRSPNIPEFTDKSVWIHAASMGEAGIAYSLASEIRRSHPGRKIVVSTVTSTGLDRIRSLNNSGKQPQIDSSFLAPFDHPLIVRSFIRAANPGLFILVETELWPSLVMELGKAQIPVAIINGKLGKTSFKRYYRFRRSFSPLAEKISLLCAQSRVFAKRFRMIGIVPSRIEVIGNVKFDGLPEQDAFDRGEVRKELGIAPDATVFVAGSTRPGEEEILLESFQDTLASYPDAVMILAPRHLNRMNEIEQIIKAQGIGYVKRSEGGTGIGVTARILILDTMGELLRAFAAADAAFVGGSLGEYGGHNPLEPAALGIPVLFGPFMEQTGSKELLSEGAAVLIHDREEIGTLLRELFARGDRHRQMSEAGPRAVSRFKGTLGRTVRALEKRRLL